MKFIKFFAVVFFMQTLFLVPGAVAQKPVIATEAVKAHKNEKYKYLLSAPEKWQEQEIKDPQGPIKLSLLSENKKISLLVMVSDKDAKTTTADFLKSMETSRQMKSLLKPEEAKISADVLKNANAKEGLRAQYEFKGKGPNFPVEQKTLVLKKDKLIYALVFAYPKADKTKLIKAIEAAESSFKIQE